MINTQFLLLQVEKIVFVVFFSGEQARSKILKICEAFGANCYPVPEDMTKRRQITREVCQNINAIFSDYWKGSFIDIIVGQACFTAHQSVYFEIYC